MNGVFIFIEWLASVNEMVCGFVWTQAIMERRFDKKHHRLYQGVLAGVIAAGVVLLNLVKFRVNYITSLYVYFALWIGSCILYKGKITELFMVVIGYSILLANASAFVFGATVQLGISSSWVYTFGWERVCIIFISQCFLAGMTGVAYAVIKRIKSYLQLRNFWFMYIACAGTGWMTIIYYINANREIADRKLSTFQVALGIILSFVLLILCLWMQIQKEKRERTYTIQQNHMLEKNYVTAKEAYETNAKLYHDMKNHFLLLQSYLKENRVEEAEAYLKKLSGDGTRYEYERYTGIEAIDYILSQKREKAENNHIHMKIHGEYPKDCKIDPVDLCTIFTNLLDNAFEACMKQPEGEPREIQVKIRRLHQFIIIKIANNSIVSPDIRNGKLHTSKNDRNLHGWGMRSVLSAVEKYQGTVQYEYHEKIFTVSVMLFYQ